MHTAGLPRRTGLDPVLVGLTAALLLTGLVMMTSASISIAESETGNAFFYLQRQGAFLLLGLTGGFMVMLIPTEVWYRTGPLLLLSGMTLLILVLLPGVGHTVNGATRWISVGPASLQVSEPARLLILMYLCGYLVRRREALQTTFIGLAGPVFLVGLACVLLLAEPDFGAATVLMATTLSLLFLGGVRLRDFLMLFVAVTGSLAVLAISTPYRLKRLTGFLNPWDDPFDSGFQLTQSLIAVGRGEWLGVGLGNSVQKMFYLPEAHTDFVFAVIAEELGFAGVLLVVALFVLLVWRAFWLARYSAEAGQFYQAYLAAGLGIWLGLQAFINMGVNLGLLPTKGLTLPLLSYGGSSLLATCIALGLLLRIRLELGQIGNSGGAHRRRSVTGRRARR
jgi:cell division protein FtsW